MRFFGVRWNFSRRGVAFPSRWSLTDTSPMDYGWVTQSKCVCNMRFPQGCLTERPLLRFSWPVDQDIPQKLTVSSRSGLRITKPASFVLPLTDPCENRREFDHNHDLFSWITTEQNDGEAISRIFPASEPTRITVHLLPQPRSLNHHWPYPILRPLQLSFPFQSLYIFNATLSTIKHTTHSCSLDL